MRRVILFIAGLYPRRWRERYGAEFAALLEDVNPDARTAVNVFTGALGMQIRTWSWGWMLVVSAACACAVFGAAMLLTPNFYRSATVLTALGPESAHARLVAIDQLSHQVESQASLTRIITAEKLYTRERARKPLEDVIETMHRNIRVIPASDPPPAGHPALAGAFEITFDAADPDVAQKVTQSLTASFIAENFQAAGKGTSGLTVSVLDPATLPVRSSRNVRLITTVAVLCGLLALSGLLLGRRLRHA